MLDLDSPEWTSLQHAYGSAEDIPALLRALPNAPLDMNSITAEPWQSLWSSLCHQNDVYSATYAAVPHIVEVAASKQPLERWHFVLLVCWAESCRNRDGAPPVGPEYETDLFAAIERMRQLTLESLGQKGLDRENLGVFLGALAVFNGWPELGEAIISFPEPYTCPECDAEVSAIRE